MHETGLGGSLLKLHVTQNQILEQKKVASLNAAFYLLLSISGGVRGSWLYFLYIFLFSLWTKKSMIVWFKIEFV